MIRLLKLPFVVLLEKFPKLLIVNMPEIGTEIPNSRTGAEKGGHMSDRYR